MDKNQIYKKEIDEKTGEEKMILVSEVEVDSPKIETDEEKFIRLMQEAEALKAIIENQK